MELTTRDGFFSIEQKMNCIHPFSQVSAGFFKNSVLKNGEGIVAIPAGKEATEPGRPLVNRHRATMMAIQFFPVSGLDEVSHHGFFRRKQVLKFPVCKPKSLDFVRAMGCFLLVFILNHLSIITDGCDILLYRKG